MYKLNKIIKTLAVSTALSISLLASPVYAQSTTPASLDILLLSQDYNTFESRLKDAFRDEASINAYLMTKLYTGHSVVYWLLGNSYAKNIVSQKYVFDNKAQIDFTKQMIYTALLLTEQDANSCVENEPKAGTDLIMKKYGYIVDFERRFTQNNLENFDKSVTFIEHLKARPAPKWICLQFGNAYRNNISNNMYGQVTSNMDMLNTRKRIIERIRYNIMPGKN